MCMGYRSTDWYQEIAESRNQNYSIVHKFGRNPAASTAWQDVWVNGGIYVWPTVASTLEAISSDANDDASTATGAQKIKIQGLDENWDDVEEEVTMNGTSATLPTTATYIRVNRVFVSEAGTYSKTDVGSNAGVITVRISSAGATQALIGLDGTVGMGQTGVARYSVPRNHSVSLYGANIQVDSGKTAQVVLWQRPNANDIVEPFTGSKRMVAHLDGVAGNVNFTFHGIPGTFPAYTDLWWSIKASAAAGVSVDFPIVVKHSEP